MNRIQRRRSKGWTMPEGAIYVGRGSRWGNPYRVGRNPWYGTWATMDAEEAVRWFRRALDGWLTADPRVLDPLRGATSLACWCRTDSPCHADVLIEALDPGATVMPSGVGGTQTPPSPDEPSQEQKW